MSGPRPEDIPQPIKDVGGGIGTVVGGAGTLLGMGGGSSDLGVGNADAFTQQLYAAEQDQTLDPQTRKEFGDAARAGNFWVADSIAKAKAGEGIYGVRRKNYELSKLLLEKPGSRQTILSVNPTPSTASGGTILGG